MRTRRAALPLLIGLIAIAAPAVADSVAVTSGADGTVIVNGKPCRVVTIDKNSTGPGASNSTTITTGPGGLSGSTTASPGGGSGSSVTVGSGSSSSSSGTQSSSAAGSDCVIYKPAK